MGLGGLGRISFGLCSVIYNEKSMNVFGGLLQLARLQLNK